MTTEKKPRVRFCWACGNKLMGNHFAEVSLPDQEEKVIMHKACAKKYSDHTVPEYPFGNIYPDMEH